MKITKTIFRALEQSPQTLFSEFSDFLSGDKRLEIPVYTVWGACEDVAILEKFRSGEYSIDNLYILDEASTHLLDIGGVNLRLFGLGGAVVQHKLFDNGEGADTIAGGLGVMWTTTLQIGELVELAASVYDPSETRVLVTLASPGRIGLLAQLALTLHADFTISAGLHFRYNIAYNEFACQPDIDHFRSRLIESQQNFMQVWESVKDQVESSVDDHQYQLLRNALNVVHRIPPSSVEIEESDTKEKDEIAFKNMWNFNLPDSDYGSLVLCIKDGSISSEMKSHGLNVSFRKNNASQNTPVPQDVSDTNKKRQSTQRNPFTAYVGGLSNTTVNENDIREFFGIDNVTFVKFPMDPTTQLPKAHCYVEFVSQTALEQALLKNGTTFRDNKLVINRPNTSFDNRRSNRASRGGRASYRDSRALHD
ncbi:hypothetical protein G6F56_010298 [Rhizopus delemar]|nr:hypothetical protein G6F56_010298 [Rhizopus delemar]